MVGAHLKSGQPDFTRSQFCHDQGRLSASTWQDWVAGKQAATVLPAPFQANTW